MDTKSSAVFSAAEMRQVLDLFSSAALERTRAGARHLLRLPVVREIATDPRMLNHAARFIGAAAGPFRAALFDKSREADWLVVWRQDTALPLGERVDAPGWGPWSMKADVLYAHTPARALEQILALRVSLDESAAGNGPSRVLPDTHRGGVYDAARISRLTESITPVDCTTAAGGVVAMRPLAVHASSRSVDSRPRRVLHIECAQRFRLAAGIELAIA